MSVSSIVNLESAAQPARKVRSIAVSFALVLSGNVFYAAAQWGMIVILARLGNPATVGQFALSLAITSPILTLTNLQLRTVLATDVSGRFRPAHCLALRIAGTCIFLAIVAVTIVAGGYNSATTVILASVAIMRAAESLSDIGYGVLQAKERMERIALSQILKGGAALGSMLATIALTGSCVAGIVVLAFTFVLTLAAFDFPSVSAATGSKHWRPEWDWHALRDLLVSSAPLGITLLLASLNVNIPRYVLQHLRGVQDVGMFTAIAYVAVSCNLLVMALGQAMAPRMAVAYETDLTCFRRFSTRLLLMAAGVGSAGLAAAITAGPSILATLYGPEYAREKNLFIWLMVAGFLSLLGSAAGFSLTSARYFRVQFPVLVLVCAVTAACCLLLVPALGTTGAAVGQLCGSAVQLTCSLGYLLFVLRRGAPPGGSSVAAVETFFEREV